MDLEVSEAKVVNHHRLVFWPLNHGGHSRPPQPCWTWQKLLHMSFVSSDRASEDEGLECIPVVDAKDVCELCLGQGASDGQPVDVEFQQNVADKKQTSFGAHGSGGRKVRVTRL